MITKIMHPLNAQLFCVVHTNGNQFQNRTCRSHYHVEKERLNTTQITSYREHMEKSKR